jgi:putative ABC transport system permease protein
MIPLSYNVRSLLVRRTTTFATALGIGLVVFVLAASMMLYNGISNTLAASGSADKAFVLRKGSEAELASNIEGPTAKLIMDGPGVKRTEAGPVAVGEVVIVIAQEKVGGEDGQISNVLVRGVPANVLEFRPEVVVVEGRPAKPGTDEVIVGARIRGRFKGLDLGQSFELKKNRPVTVVGVFEAGGSSFESEVWVDIETARTSFGRENLVSSVTVALESPTAFDAFKAHVESDKRLGLEVLRESQYYEKQSGQTGTFVLAMGIMIAVFFSIGAIIGAMITMYGAVAQRRREIGALRALGFSRMGLMFSFLFEAVVLSLIGGVIGIVAAIPMGVAEISMMNFSTWSEIVFEFDLSPGVIITSLIFGCGMGVIGGFFPAFRAARISPIEAMRG